MSRNNEINTETQIGDLAEMCRSLGFVLLPIEPNSQIIEALSRYTYQTYCGSWEIARKDATDAYSTLVAVAQL